VAVKAQEIDSRWTDARRAWRDAYGM